MTVHHLPAAGSQADSLSDEIARELVTLAGRDALLLPDDGTFDPYAVELAANGVRVVRLTLAERVAAATRVLASGASVRSVCLRLGLPEGTEQRWREIRRRSVSVISALVIIAAIGYGVFAASRSVAIRARAHQVVHIIHRTSRDSWEKYRFIS